MDRQELLQLVKNPGAVSTEHHLSLAELQRNYPYFQAVRVLTAKLDTSQRNIRSASVHVADRDLLQKILVQNYNPNTTVTDLTEVLKEEETNAFDKLENPEKETEPPPVEPEKQQDKAPEEPEPKAAQPESKEEPIQTLHPVPTLEELFLLDLEFGEESKTNFFHDILAQQNPPQNPISIPQKAHEIDFGNKAKSSFFEDKIENQKKQDIRTTNSNLVLAREEVHRLREAISETQAEQKVIVIDDISTNELINLDDDLSFFDNVEDKIKTNTTDSQERWQSLIEKFIKEEPSIGSNRSKTTIPENTIDLAKKSTENRFFISENLALIYTKQGKKQRAIEIYKKLILKYPEKSCYFADRIEKLKA